MEAGGVTVPSQDGLKRVAQLRIASGFALTSTLRSRIADRAPRLGFTLKASNQDAPGAKAAYELAIELGDRGAVLDLAQLLRDEADVVGTHVLYQRLVNSDDDVNGVASWDLAQMLDRVGDAVGARAAYQQLIDRRQ